MTKEQLRAELSELELAHDKAKREVYKRYAFSNNPYKIGEFVTDHVATIKIEKISFYVSYGES